MDSQLTVFVLAACVTVAHADRSTGGEGPPASECQQKYDKDSPLTRTNACKPRTVFRSNGGLVSANGRYTFVQHNGEHAPRPSHIRVARSRQENSRKSSLSAIVQSVCASSTAASFWCETTDRSPTECKTLLAEVLGVSNAGSRDSAMLQQKAPR